MKTLALFILFSWPWSTHIEKFTVTISAEGHAVYPFKKKFNKTITCTSTGKGLEWYADRVVVHGTPGDKVTGSCQ